ncbi:hypothetical protein ACP4OV_018122 [Aristida adscensionis]
MAAPVTGNIVQPPFQKPAAGGQAMWAPPVTGNIVQPPFQQPAAGGQAMWAPPPVTGNIVQPPFQMPAAGGGRLYMDMPSGPIVGETAAASTPRAGSFSSSAAVHLVPTHL